MENTFFVARIQTSVDDSLRYVGTLIEQAAHGGALGGFARVFSCLSADETTKPAVAEADNDDPMPVVSDAPDKVYSVCPYVCADRRAHCLLQKNAPVSLQRQQRFV